MDYLEQNIINSFRLAKSDIIKLQNAVIELSQSQEKILKLVEEMRIKQAKLDAKVKGAKEKKAKTGVTIVKTVGKSAKKVYVAAKTGKRFHITSCPFAQNIKPKSRVIFKSKNAALNRGFKPCKCVR